METTDISDRDANNDEINNNHNNETINVLHDPIDDVGTLTAVVDDDVNVGDAADVGVTGADIGATGADVGITGASDVGVTDAVGDVTGAVADIDVADDVADTDDVGSTNAGAVGDSNTVTDNSNNNAKDSSDSNAEIAIEKVDTTATISNDYDNEVIIDSDYEHPVAAAAAAVEHTNNVLDDNNDKNDNDSENDNDKSKDDEHQSSMFNPILSSSSSTRSDHAFSPSNYSATQLSSSSTTTKDDHSDRKSGAKLDAIDLCYSVIINGKLKKILKNINFSLEPGCMCALLGSSTAGKR